VVAAGDDRPAADQWAEDPCRVVGGSLVGLPRLVVPPPREPLLALATGLGAALDVALSDLVLGDRLAGHPRDPEATLAHEEQSPRRRRSGRGG
jgi:hypothetical protein